MQLQNMKLNAPSFSYKCRHNKNKFISARNNTHAKHMVDGIAIDSAIPVSAIRSLNKLDIETRSSCQGTFEYPTYLIFRLPNKSSEDIDILVNEYNKKYYPSYKACWNIGMQGQPRIIITAKIYYENNSLMFKKWWTILPKTIKDIFV